MKRALISYTLPWSKYIWLWYFQFTILDWQKYNLIIQTILLDPTPLANRVVSPSFKKKTCSYYISYAILNSISHLSPLWPPTRKWPSKPTSIKSSGTNQRVCPTYTLNSIQGLQSKQYILTNAEYLLLYHLILLLSSLWTQAHRANHNAGVIISCYLNRTKTILHSPTLSTYCCTMLLSSLWTWALRAHHTDEDIILNRPKLNSTTHQRWVLLSPTQ